MSIHVKIVVCFPSGFSSVTEGAAGRSLNMATAVSISDVREHCPRVFPLSLSEPPQPTLGSTRTF